ncbi:hypothetical protein LXL04_033674 [Taraxacum kok-saghyz]
MFNAVTLNEPPHADWYMDTGATTHLHTDPGILRSVQNNALPSSVLVGDGSHIPTKRTLLRCDSTGDLYPVTKPTAQALFSIGSIQLRFSCPYTSQQNGKSERMIRTINNVIRTLLFHAHVPPQYWVEALHMAVYLSNILPSTTLNNTTPYHKLFNEPPKYDHLRVFGCLCYPHTVAPHKLAPRTTPCVFLGYPVQHRGYRCLDLETNKTFISRHVIFDETSFPFSSMTPVQSPSYCFLDHDLDDANSISKSFLCSSSPSTDTHTSQPSSPAVESPLVADFHPPGDSTSNAAAHSDTAAPPLVTTSSTGGPHDPPVSTAAPSVAVPSRSQPTPSAPTHTMHTRLRHGIVKPVHKLNLHVDTTSPVPRSYSQDFRDPNWQNAMKEEYQALISNRTWTLVSRSTAANVINCIWLLKNKHNADRSLARYKARLVANGKAQCPGIDCDENFSPVVKPATIRTVLSLAVSHNWPIRQLDVKNAFLHGHLQETLYMHQPPDHLLQQITSTLASEFAMTDLGNINYFLGIAVTRDSKGMFLSQYKYVLEILDRAKMLNCKPARTPTDTTAKLGDIGPLVSDPTLYRSLVGALQYLTFTRPNIAYAVQQICLYMHDPREPHLNALKRILRYLRGTDDYGLHLFCTPSQGLVAYSDADWAGCPTTRRSTSGFCIFLGSNLISWSSKRQSIVSRSFVEAEYRGVANSVVETSWIQNLLRELHCPPDKATIVFCDNVSAVYMTGNPVQHQRTKHIEIDIHFVRDRVATGHIRVLHVPSSSQYADIFTKDVPTPLLNGGSNEVGLGRSTCPNVDNGSGYVVSKDERLGPRHAPIQVKGHPPTAATNTCAPPPPRTPVLLLTSVLIVLVSSGSSPDNLCEIEDLSTTYAPPPPRLIASADYKRPDTVFSTVVLAAPISPPTTGDLSIVASASDEDLESESEEEVLEEVEYESDGGPESLPLIGNVHQLAGKLPHRAFRDLARKHGPIMHIQLGQISAVIISSPRLAEQVLKTNDIALADRPTTFGSDLVLHGNTDIALAPYGEYWRQMKNIASLELLSAKKVRSFGRIREQELNGFMELLESRRMSDTGGTGDRGGSSESYAGEGAAAVAVVLLAIRVMNQRRKSRRDRVTMVAGTAVENHREEEIDPGGIQSEEAALVRPEARREGRREDDDEGVQTRVMFTRSTVGGGGSRSSSGTTGSGRSSGGKKPTGRTGRRNWKGRKKKNGENENRRRVFTLAGRRVDLGRVVGQQGPSLTSGFYKVLYLSVNLEELLRLSSGKPIDIQKTVTEVINNVVCIASFGKNCKQQHALLDFLDEFARVNTGFYVADLFPDFKFLYVVSGHRSRLMKLYKTLDKIFDDIWEEHEGGIKNHGGDHEEDLLEVLLRIKEEGGLGFPITNNNIKAIFVKRFYFSTIESDISVVSKIMSESVKEMTSKFSKLEKFYGVDFRRWQKKMHFLLTTLKVVYVLSTPRPAEPSAYAADDEPLEHTRRRDKWDNDDYICRGHILNVQYIAEDASSKKFLVSDFNNYKMVDSRPVMEQYNEILRILGQFTQHKMSMDECIAVSSIIDKLPPSWKDFKHTLKHQKEELSLVQLGSHIRIEESLRVQDSDKIKGKTDVGQPSVHMVEDDDYTWWVDSGATSHMCKDRRWFEKLTPVDDGYTVMMGDDSSQQICGYGIVNLQFTSGKTIKLCDVLFVPKLRKNLVSGGCLNSDGFKQVDLCDFHGTPSLCNKKYVITFIDDSSRFCYVYLLHSKDKALEKFKIYKTEVEVQLGNLVKCLRTDRGGEYMDPHVTSRKGFWGEAMLTACYVLNRVPNKRNKTTPYELWFKKDPNLGYFRIWGCWAVVKLTDPKRNTLGEKGIDCIFIGYAQHSKAYRFYIIDPNDTVSVNTVIESRDAIFDEMRFSSIPRPMDLISKSNEGHNSESLKGTSDLEPQEIRKSKRGRIAKNFGSDFQLYLVEGSRDEEAIDDEMSSILENNTWVLSNLPPGSKALGCKWIFKKKMNVDGTIDKFKARLVIQGFRQKPGVDYFDTYTPVVRISTIRLLIALASIHNLVIHQMDVKTAFLNGELDEEVYMKQQEGFVMPGKEHMVCKLIKSLYGLKQAPKQWHQKFDDVILSSGFKLSPCDKCVYSRFDATGAGVIICLYVDDMLIFSTDQNQVDKTNQLLSSKFSMKDLGEADVILGIRIKRVNKCLVMTQSHYIEKILKRFNLTDCSPVSTPMDPSVKLMDNTGKPVSQLEYSMAIGSLIYAMTSTRPDIAFAVGKLSRYTSNPSAQHWQAMNRVFKYLKGTMDYGLSYLGHPSGFEGHSDASWIPNMEDHSSTSGWVFLLGGGAISWSSKKQSCITLSTMESEFVALAAAGKEAEWLRNIVYEIPLWSKPIASISILCDNAAALAKAYSQFVKSTQNLADHLTKSLSRDLVHKNMNKGITYMIVKYSRTSESRDLAFIRSRMDWDTRLDNSVFKWVEGFNS